MKEGLKKRLLWSFAVSAAITFISWLLLGISSPLNHGISPDVDDKPFIAPFVILNLPAGIVAVNLVGKQGPEWGYFALIFLQWLLIGALLSAVLKKQKGN